MNSCLVDFAVYLSHLHCLLLHPVGGTFCVPVARKLKEADGCLCSFCNTVIPTLLGTLTSRL